MNKKLLSAATIAAGLPWLSAAAQIPVSASAEGLEQVTVTASRMAIPKNQTGVSVSVLTGADIERLGYTTLLDVMRTLPGISISNNGGAGKVSAIYMRGESNYRTLVLLDGVNIADPTNTQVGAQFQHLLADHIERIEVLRGPQGMMYGAGAGGVINIISKRAEEPLALQLAAETGRYRSREARANISGKIENWNYAINLSDFSNDGFNARDSDASDERDGYENRSGAARLGYQISEAFSVEGQLRRTDTETEFDACFDISFSPTDNCLDKYTQTSYQLSGNYQAEKNTHKLLLAQQEIERDSLAGGDSTFAVDGAIDELNYTGNSALAAGDLSWGAELERQEYRSEFTEQDLDSLGLFTEWRASLAQKLYYSFGYRRDQLETDDHNSWRISAAYPKLLSGNQKIKYRASYSTGFRAPSPFEIAHNISESAAAVGPEASRGYELGFEYQWAELLQLELVVFEQKIQDAIVYDFALGTSGFGAYGQDDGESESSGLELSLAGQLSEAARWYANGTWLDAVDTQDKQRLQVAQQVYNFGLSYALLGEKLSLSGNWQRVAGRLSPDPVSFGSSVALDDYNKLDINAVYNLSQSVRLTLRGENILDEDYREVAGYNTAGAAVYAGVQFTL